VKIKWLGHAAFLITSTSGIRILTDPYNPGGELTYRPIRETADIVTISHGHFDHGNAAVIAGKPEVIRESGIKITRGITFTGLTTYHDDVMGRQRGSNVVYIFTVDGMKLLHAGDLGHLPSPQLAEQVGQVDIAMVPTGGTYTIGPAQAWDFCQQVNARVILPMHYRTPRVNMPLSGIDDFTKGKPSVKKVDSSEIEVVRDRLPAQEIVVLKPAY
jgi:L-ascorbate metabolism protein UlaG (beta-lactamase superfamily)